MASRLAHLSSPLLARLAVGGMALAILAVGALPIWAIAVSGDDQRDLAKAGFQTSGHLRAVQALGDIDAVTDDLEEGLARGPLADLRLAERVLHDALARMVREDLDPKERQLALDAIPVVRQLMAQIEAFVDAVRTGDEDAIVETEERMEDTLHDLQVRFSDVRTDPSQVLHDELGEAAAGARMVQRVTFVLVPLGLLCVVLCGWQLRAYRRRSLAERERMEAQLRDAQKMEAVGRLAGGIAHDFNNLLTAVLGYGERLTRSDDDRVRHDAEEICRAATRAADLTRQMLAFGRPQALEPQALDLNEVVAGIGTMLRRLIGEDIEVVTVPGPSVPAVNADAGQLEQVLMNLTVNARDAMPGGGHLTIAVGEEVLAARDADVLGLKPGRYVRLSVSDDGVGIEADTLEHVFEPFFTTKGKGTGLGLAIVYGIVRQSSGGVRVESSPGAGSTFSVLLPATDGLVAVAREPAPARTPVERGHERVLVVEDEDVVRRFAVHVLADCGYEVLEASYGGEAVELCERFAEPIDLLLTDVVMPGMSGVDLAERVRQLRPGIKVVFMSGYSDGHRVDAPGSTFLPKPFGPDQLSQVVRRALDEPAQAAA